MVTKVRTHKIASWDALMSAFRKLDDGNWGFRGVIRKEYDLLPSVGREQARKIFSKTWEKEVFYKFKQHALPYVSKPPVNDFGWLAIARHYGLPTRLLDWTLSPLAATYFAVAGPRPEKGDPPDCAVYAFRNEAYEDDDEVKDKDLFSKHRTVRVVDAAHYIARIPAQRGFFTLHGQPNRPFRPKSLNKFIIPGRLCDDFQAQLDFYGFNHAMLFPDLDGLGRYWAWCYRTWS